MKSSKHMPTLILLVLSTVILSGSAYYGRTTIYEQYSLNIEKEPLLTILMEGLGDRIFPWDNILQTSISNEDVVPSENEISVSENLTAAPSPEQSEITVSANTISDENPANTLPYTLGMVDASYFDDALFIGDSRTVGLHDYASLIHATYYAKVSSTIFEIMDDEMITIPSEEYPHYGKSKISVRDALGSKHFAKIYIMVGINELGTGTPDIFYDQYKSVIDDIHALQPDALIFIQAIMHVTSEKSNTDPIYNNANIDVRNDKIKTLADNQTIFYLDLNTALDDTTGGLNPDYTFDSVHLKASQYILWENYLLSNGAVKQ